MKVIEDGVGTVPMHPGIDSARISHFTFSIFHLLWRSLREVEVSRGGRGERGGGAVGAFFVHGCHGLRGGASKIFTTEYAETRFAGRGRQFEKFSFGFDTGDPPAFYGFWSRGRWACEAKISNRLPCPAEPVSAPSVV